MKLFLDTADIDAIRRAHATGLLDGVTTNPSHVAKANRIFEEVVSDICAIIPGHVSVEAVADTADGLVAGARRLAALAPQIVIKIPIFLRGHWKDPPGSSRYCALGDPTADRRVLESGLRVRHNHATITA
jgi:transaldolase